MKKTFLAVAAAIVALTTVTACSNKTAAEQANEQQPTQNTTAKATADREQVYVGDLPAADAAGVRYTLKLEFDDDHNYTDGDYDLIETYLIEDNDKEQLTRTFTSEGDFTVKTQGDKTYLELICDRHDSDQGANQGPIYLLVTSDKTLELVGADLQPAASGLNYTLTRTR